MPSIQVDLPLAVDTAAKRTLARRFGEIYADTMQVNADLLTVVVHASGTGSVWRCQGGDEPRPSALIMCDVRAGRSADTRAVLAQSLIAVCVELFDLDPTWIKVEFTQHRGDEMFHPHLGGWNREWTGAERTDSS